MPHRQRKVLWENADMQEQAETIVRNAKKRVQMLFLKAVCSDGKKRFM